MKQVLKAHRKVRFFFVPADGAVVKMLHQGVAFYDSTVTKMRQIGAHLYRLKDANVQLWCKTDQQA